MGQWRQAGPTLQKFPRVATSVPVRVSTVDAEVDPVTGRRFFRSTEETTANLSRGGAYVHSWEPLAAGRRVLVTLSLPDEPELQLEARVIWTKRAIGSNDHHRIEPAGYGLAFTSGDRDELAILDRYLTRQTARRSPTPQAPAPATPTV